MQPLHFIYLCTRKVWDEFLISYHSAKYVYQNTNYRLCFHIICDEYVKERMTNKQNVFLYPLVNEKDGSHHVSYEKCFYRNLIEKKLTGARDAMKQIGNHPAVLIDTDTLFLYPFSSGVINIFTKEGNVLTGAIEHSIREMDKQRVGRYNGGVLFFNAERASNEFMKEWISLFQTNTLFYEQSPYSVLVSLKWRTLFQPLNYINNYRQCTIINNASLNRLDADENGYMIHDNKYKVRVLHAHLLNWEADEETRDWNYKVVKFIIEKRINVAPYFYTILRSTISKNIKITDISNQYFTSKIPQKYLSYIQTSEPPYPCHQTISQSVIEWKFFEHVIENKIQFTKYKYIPLMITNFIVNTKNFKDLKNLLEEYLTHYSLFIIIQHSSGLRYLPTVPPLKKLIIFNAGGGSVVNSNNTITIPIPLLPEPHYVDESIRYRGTRMRKWKISYVGNKTHSIRKKMQILFENKKECFWQNSADDIQSFEEIMKDSVFALCPRGFGPTSFRMYEAMEYGCIPVYIYTGSPYLPYMDEIDWNELAILCPSTEVDTLYDRLVSMSEEEIERKREYMFANYDKYFTLPGLFNWIVKRVVE